MARAAQAAGREDAEVRLLAVSKRHPAAAIRALHALGQSDFGENFVQEALEKMTQLNDLEINWHFIGPIQSNKTRAIAEHFDWVHSVDREKILRRLSAQRPAGLPELNLCLQVNIDQETSKSGVEPGQVQELANLADELPGLRLRGLMAIPEPASDTHDPEHSFARMQALQQGLLDSGLALDTLSMGMSADLEQAIRQGSTMVRIGTDIFGPREV